MTVKQKTIEGPDDELDTKPKRTILPPHERIARDEKNLADRRARLVQALLARESELLDDLRELVTDCDLAKDDGAARIAGRCSLAIDELEKKQ